MITRYYQEILNFCRGKVKDQDTAADLAQESFARILLMQQSGQVIREPRALLRKIALHLKIDMDRRANIRKHDDIDDLHDADMPTQPTYLQPEEAYAASQMAKTYVQAIEALPSRCREAFTLYVVDDLPNKEIAERMGISLSMVNQYISRGKLACAACREIIEGLNGDE